jgi:hypothetical protein
MKMMKVQMKRLEDILEDETQVQANENMVGTKEGIESRWSWGFGLDELGA